MSGSAGIVPAHAAEDGAPLLHRPSPADQQPAREKEPRRDTRLGPALQDPYRSVRSPWYRATRWCSSSVVSGRPASRREHSSAAAMKARRSRRLTTCRYRSGSRNGGVSLLVSGVRSMAVLASLETERNAPAPDVRNQVAPIARFEPTTQVGDVCAKGAQIDIPPGAHIRRPELVGNHGRQGRSVPQRRPDGLVAGIRRGLVLHRTDVLIADNQSPLRRRPVRAALLLIRAPKGREDGRSASRSAGAVP